LRDGVGYNPAKPIHSAQGQTMDKSNGHSLTPAKAQTVSTASASLAGRGLSDFQKTSLKLWHSDLNANKSAPHGRTGIR